MKPIKPKFSNTVKLDVQISDVSKKILTLYARYTKYTESEIIDRLISEIKEDDVDFVVWLIKQRNKKKINSKILSDVVFEESEDSDID